MSRDGRPPCPPCQKLVGEALSHSGLSPDVVTAWENGWRCQDVERVAEHASAYDHNGVPPTEAVGWYQAGFDAEQGVALFEAGWSVEQGETLALFVNYFEVDDWIGTGLPPAQVLLLLRAGVGFAELPTVLAQSDRAALQMMAALLSSAEPPSPDRS